MERRSCTTAMAGGQNPPANEGDRSLASC
jgi:hypothetical protein